LGGEGSREAGAGLAGGVAALGGSSGACLCGEYTSTCSLHATTDEPSDVDTMGLRALLLLSCPTVVGVDAAADGAKLSRLSELGGSDDRMGFSKSSGLKLWSWAYKGDLLSNDVGLQTISW